MRQRIISGIKDNRNQKKEDIPMMKRNSSGGYSTKDLGRDGIFALGFLLVGLGLTGLFFEDISVIDTLANSVSALVVGGFFIICAFVLQFIFDIIEAQKQFELKGELYTILLINETGDNLTIDFKEHSTSEIVELIKQFTHTP